MKIRVCVMLSTLWLAQSQAWAVRYSSLDVPIRYSVTDLGTSYELGQAADGSIESLTAADGLSTFAFSKVPVQYNPQGTREHSGASTNDFVARDVLRLGDVSVGYYGMDFRSSEGVWNIFNTRAWVSYGIPISDMNKSFNIVGTLNSYEQPIGSDRVSQVMHAAVRLVGEGQTSTSDYDLNFMIDRELPLTLTSAIKIDDLGRIIAVANSGYTSSYYLLTPKELGPAEPLTVPEPSTLVVMGGMVAFGAMRGLNRRRK